MPVIVYGGGRRFGDPGAPEAVKLYLETLSAEDGGDKKYLSRLDQTSVYVLSH